MCSCAPTDSNLWLRAHQTMHQQKSINTHPSTHIHQQSLHHTQGVCEWHFQDREVLFTHLCPVKGSSCLSACGLTAAGVRALADSPPHAGVRGRDMANRPETERTPVHTCGPELAVKKLLEPYLDWCRHLRFGPLVHVTLTHTPFPIRRCWPLTPCLDQAGAGSQRSVFGKHL